MQVALELYTVRDEAARDFVGGSVEAFDRLREGGIGEAAAGWPGAFDAAGGETDEGGAGVDRSVSGILGGEFGSV